LQRTDSSGHARLSHLLRIAVVSSFAGA
jgi:hypothetical protein